MKLLRFLLSIILIGSIFISCQKDNTDSTGGTLLEIDPANNCYISQDGEHFYSNVFSSKDDIDQYRIAVKKGVRYKIICSQPDDNYARIEMFLLNSNMDTITFSGYNNDVSVIYHTSTSDGQLYLKVRPVGSYHESLGYRLYFEIGDPIPVDFLGMECDYSGDWQVMNSGSLKFTTVDARLFRWFRFNWSFQDNPDISFTIKSADRTELPSFGLAFNGSAELIQLNDYKDELPQNCTFFQFLDNESFTVMKFNDYSISFNNGNFDPHNVDIQSGVDIDITYSGGSYSIYLNGAYLWTVSSSLMNRFYLEVEDDGNYELTFENIKIE